MKHRRPIAIWTLALAVAAAAAPAGAQYLTGGERASFIEHTAQACVADRLKDPVTARIEPPLFAAYCQCFATRTVDRLTKPQLLQSEPAAVQPLLQEIAAACMTEVAKSVPAR